MQIVLKLSNVKREKGSAIRRQSAQRSAARMDTNSGGAHTSGSQCNSGRSNLERLHQLLQETATYPGRSFEWYYWQRQTHLELRTFRGHASVIRFVSFSPNAHR